MNPSKIVRTLALLFFAAIALGQMNASGQAPSAGKPVITGVWRGEKDNLPLSPSSFQTKAAVCRARSSSTCCAETPSMNRLRLRLEFRNPCSTPLSMARPFSFWSVTGAPILPEACRIPQSASV